MAVTRISDVIVPEVFFNYMAKDTTEKTLIFQSGILRSDDALSGGLAGGGRTFNVPFWKDLDNTESGTASDDPNVSGVPGSITSSKDICRRQVRTRGWSTADLAGILAGSDPMGRIRDRVTGYWDRQFQRILLAELKGVYNDNVANFSSDMVKDISVADANTTATDAELISAEAIIDANYTMGDNSEGLRLMVMHSTVMKRLVKLNLIDFEQDSKGMMTIPMYMGKRVIVDDSSTTVVGTYKTKYFTYMIGDGAFGWAEVPVATPVEVDRYPAQGNGMGVEQLWTRRQFVMHPYGIKFTDSSVGGEFPSNTELAVTANWSRVYPERKQINLAYLITNG